MDDLRKIASSTTSAASTSRRATTGRSSPTTRLITGGIVDSFSMVSLKRFLERKYDVKIPDADATPEAFDTVDTIAALVERLAPVKA